MRYGAMDAYNISTAALSAAGGGSMTQLELAETLRLFLSRFLTAVAREELRGFSFSADSHAPSALSTFADACGSDRLRKLVQVLLEARAAAAAAITSSSSSLSAGASGGEAGAASGGFRALVFVQRRVACRVLCDYLQQHPAFRGRSGFALGEAGPRGLAGAMNPLGSSAAGGGSDAAGGVDKVDAASVGPTEAGRAGVVERFDSGELELLVATSVLSQGIDVQACGLVVVLDEIPTDIAFTQMRGRARRGDGEFVVFASSYTVGCLCAAVSLTTNHVFPACSRAHTVLVCSSSRRRG
jgi:hypothetical protein